MAINSDTLSRIAKLFVDRDDVSLEEAERQLAQFRVVLRCGPEMAASPTLQAALLTAANVAHRCFPGGVHIDLPNDMSLCVPWAPGRTLRSALIDVIGAQSLQETRQELDDAVTIAFGSVEGRQNGIQATFDGWAAAVSPLAQGVRLPEREACVLAGVLLGALAVSEVFLGNFGFAIEAGSRPIGMSLWRPDLPWNAPAAAGVEAPVCHLPGELWLVGLGHLGQAFAWACGLLPFSLPSSVTFAVQDFDRLVQSNLDTSLLSYSRDIGRLKTRIVCDFLERRGFRPHLIERRFDEQTRPQRGEPTIALFGMDSKGPRHLLDQAGFDLAIDCGVGGSVANFDSITLNALPNSRTTATALWPPDEDRAAWRQQGAKQLADSRKLYREVSESHACGHVELAGRSVAVPFVGAASAALVFSELLRRLMGGPQCDRIRLQLTALDMPAVSLTESSMSRLRILFQAVAARRA